MAEQHPGWEDRIQLDPVQVPAQGVGYTDACALLLRQTLLRRWANDPSNNQWHPAETFELKLESSGSLAEPQTWLLARMAAVFRPASVPAEVLDHRHDSQCRHDLGPHELIEGAWTCFSCGDYHFTWFLCPERCISTEYAVRSLRQPYEPPERAA